MYTPPFDETRYLVLSYLPTDSSRFQLEGPTLVETRDYIHFYLTGTRLPIDTFAYVLLREYPLGTTEEQATDFFIHGFNELLRAAMTCEHCYIDWLPTIEMKHPALLERVAA